MTSLFEKETGAFDLQRASLYELKSFTRSAQNKAALNHSSSHFDFLAVTITVTITAAQKRILKSPWSRAAQTNSVASWTLKANEKQPPPSPAPQFRRPITMTNCRNSRWSKQTRAHFSQNSRGKDFAWKADNTVFAVLRCCCCTFIYTIPSTIKVRNHGSELYTRGTPAQTGNIKRGKERKRAVIIGLLRNRGMLKDSHSSIS